MQYTRLGRTALKVSRLCLGTMNFGPQTSEADSFAIMDHALEVGINFFDTANVYGWKKGEGVTEQILGRWFAQGGGRRDKVVLATKVFGAMGDWPNEARLSALHIRRACEDSLRRLDTDYIDLYQFHDNGFPPEQAQPVRDTLEELAAEGKIRAYGWSTDFPKSAEFFAQGKQCTAIQLQLNVFESNPQVLAVCEKYDLAAINRGPLAMGLLTGKYTVATKPSVDDVRGVNSPEWMKYFKNGQPNPEFLKQREAVAQLLTSGGRTLAQGALAWLWGRSPKTLPIPGFRTVAQVEENCRALAFGPLDPAQMQQIESILAEKK
jgi:aryl-alcohol dehydrogenase-like predicted oxidoreductase